MMLAARLARASREADLDPLPPALVRRLVAYARCFVHPVLSDEACAVLQDFWLRCRQAVVPEGGIPVTVRQLDGLVRLAEARARVDLAPEVTAAHARDVVEIAECSLSARGNAPPGERGNRGGERDSKRRRGGKAAEAQRLHEAALAQCRRGGVDTIELSQLYELADLLQTPGDVGALIEALGDEGLLLKRGPARYRVTGVVRG